MKRLLLVTLLSLGACAQAPMIWDKDGATQSDFNKNDYECRKDAIAAGGTVYVGFGLTERAGDLGIYQRCMAAAGYALRR